jgi:hypothetical protein
MSRIRADRVTDRAGTGAVEITYGANITGVTTAAHLSVTGVTTCTGVVVASTGINVSGVVTATSFVGDGSSLSGVSAGLSSAKAYTFNQIFS